MKIKLNSSSILYEIAKVNVSEINNVEISYIEMSFNKDALIGFAKNLIWMYEDIEKNRKFYVCTDPLGGVPSGNQVLGFYLTKNSPILVFRINYLNDYDAIKCLDNEIQPKLRTEKCIEVLPPLADNDLEDYEIGFKNIADIKIYSNNNIDISGNINEVLFEINYEGLKKLAIIMFKLAENFDIGKEYDIAILDKNDILIESEIVLTSDSIPLKLKCVDIGSVYDYEPNFGC